jgi:hypothetical protein
VSKQTTCLSRAALCVALLALLSSGCGGGNPTSNTIPTDYLLTVTRSGAGTGTVTASSGNLDCSNGNGTICTASYSNGASVTLTATPTNGSSFGGWSGDCSGAGTSATCVVSMTADRNVGAAFGAGSGGGIVNGELFSTDFATGTAGQIFDEVWGANLPTVVADATALSGRSLRFDWDSGFENYNGAVKVVTGTNRRKLHVRVRLKQAGGADNGGIQKIIRFRPDINGVEATAGTVNFQWGDILFYGDSYGDGNNHVQSTMTQATHGPDTFRGQWRYLEVMLDYTDLSVQHVMVWVDGTLVLDDQIPLNSPMSATLNMNRVMFLGTFNSPADDRFDYVDKIDISASFMGIP